MLSGKKTFTKEQIPFSGLIVASTPIGNLGDLTPRTEAALSSADLIACEDTRHTGKLLAHLGIKAKMIAYHNHSDDNITSRLITALKNGQTVVLVSDAGTPLISDPGYKLVATCRDEGIPVTSFPGASAALAGLAASGLPTDQFYFAGFLPHNTKKKRDRLQDLMHISSTIIFYESPKRIAETLDIMARLYPERQTVIGRELTKLHETFYHGSVSELVDQLRGVDLKGELVLMLGPLHLDKEFSDDDILAALNEALAHGLTNKDAVAHVTALSGRTKRDVYGIALKLATNSHNAVS